MKSLTTFLTESVNNIYKKEITSKDGKLTQVEYHNNKGQRHNPNGPALIRYDGNGNELYHEWYLNDKKHRIGGPAKYTSDGLEKEFYVKGKRHNVGAPAVVRKDGIIQYWQEDYLHNINGPAVIFPDGKTEFWIGGKQIHDKKKYDFLVSNYKEYKK